ncbi:hypothetical protein [Planctobacterium marinum]|uniref:hypothetical protein n=1 Tax=Planctobacterium marinum TaxID=1631968 RepID=UPI001E34E1BA|nr:hypothetical protein [Planctobacterium marinum]MCC2608011.1 hypothetical protein [Planctobacterium marinum]
MSVRDIKIKAHSQSVNKVVSRFENEFQLKANGGKPTEKLQSIIEQIKEKMPGINNEIDDLILEAYAIGAQSGFDRALSRFQDGKIRARKVANESEWTLFSSSKKYQITDELPSAKDETIKATVHLYLADSGFE